MRQKRKKQRNLQRRPLALLLALVMVVSMIPATALAADTGTEEHTITVVLENPGNDEALQLKYGGKAYKSGTPMVFDPGEDNTIQLTGLDSGKTTKIDDITVFGTQSGEQKIPFSKFENQRVANAKIKMPVSISGGQVIFICMDCGAPTPEYSELSFNFDYTDNLNEPVTITIHTSDVQKFQDQKEAEIKKIKTLSAEENETLQVAINVAEAMLAGAQTADELDAAVEFAGYAVDAAKKIDKIEQRSRNFLYLDRQSAVISAGGTLTLKADVMPEGAVATWDSSDPDVATVDNTGTISAVSAGFTTITARANGLKAKCEVTVNDAEDKKWTINATGKPVPHIGANQNSDRFKVFPSVVLGTAEESTPYNGSQYFERILNSKSRLSFLSVNLEGEEKNYSLKDIKSATTSYNMAVAEEALSTGSRNVNLFIRYNEQYRYIHFELQGRAISAAKNCNMTFHYLDSTHVEKAMKELKAYRGGRDEFRTAEQEVYDTIVGGAETLMNKIWADSAEDGNTQRELDEKLNKQLDFLETLMDGLKTDAEYTGEENFSSAQALISALNPGSITLQNEAQVQAARAAYDKLTADQKKQIRGYEKLTQAEKKIADLKTEAAKKPDDNSEPQVKPSAPASVTTARRNEGLNSKEKVAWSKGNLKVTWGKVQDADGYDVFVKKCDGKDFTSRNIAESVKKASATSATIRKLNGKKFSAKCIYKVRVRAWRKVNGKKKYIANGLMLHISGGSHQKCTNPKSVSVSNVKKNAVTLKAGKAKTLKASVVKVNKKKKLVGHTGKLRYFSTNTKVAKVSSSGRITAKKAGKCAIYAVAENGAKKKITVTVK